jgi:hypothetical protein
VANLGQIIKYLFIVALLLISATSYSDTKGIIKPYFYDKNVVLDSQIKTTKNVENVKIAATLVPLQIRSHINSWQLVPEYYMSVKNDSCGKVTIGAHNSNLLLIDPGSFAVGNGDILSDGNGLYSQSLINNLQPQFYQYKISYLFTKDDFYFSSAYSPINNRKQLNFLYVTTISSSTDFKASVSLVNSQIVTGFNLRYLGFIFGGSYGNDFYTAGLGYSIGPLKSSLTYLSKGQNTIFGLQYNINKNMSPFLQIGYSNKDRYIIGLGIRFNL